MSCPISLECLADLCPNLGYCNDMAAPWPLPYQIWDIDYWYDKGTLLVSIPNPTNWDEVGNSDHEIDAADRYDIWINYIRRELREAGWENPIDLPYDWDGAEKVLIVTVLLIWGEQEGFAPAVKLDNWRANWKSTRSKLWQMASVPTPNLELDQWGFYLADGVPGLAWKWQEEAD